MYEKGAGKLGSFWGGRTKGIVLALLLQLIGINYLLF
jgi:hypothetical protein